MAQTPSLRPAGRRTLAGMTLIEILLVLGLMGVIVGGGLGVFAALDVERRQATGLVKSVVRAARNTALSLEVPTRVRLDPQAGSLRAEALRVIGTWYFEDEGLSGAFGIGGALGGGALTDAGWIGQALTFESGGSVAAARIAVDESPLYSLREGFGLDLWLRIDELSSATVLDLGGAVGLELTRAGALRGWMVPEVEDDFGRSGRGQRVMADAGLEVVPLARWMRVQLTYDRRELALTQDGVRVAAELEERPVWRVERPLELGGTSGSLAGVIDTLVIAAVEASEVLELPEGVRFAGDSAAEVWFDSGGGLDRRRHRGPATVGLMHSDASREDVRVGLYGTVDSVAVGD